MFGERKFPTLDILESDRRQCAVEEVVLKASISLRISKRFLPSRDSYLDRELLHPGRNGTVLLM